MLGTTSINVSLNDSDGVHHGYYKINSWSVSGRSVNVSVRTDSGTTGQTLCISVTAIGY